MHPPGFTPECLLPCPSSPSMPPFPIQTGTPTTATLGPPGHNQVPCSTAPAKFLFTPTLRTCTHAQKASPLLTNFTPGWHESSEGLQWRTTAAHSLKQQPQAKVHLNREFLWTCCCSTTSSRKRRRTWREGDLLHWVSMHTASSTTHPGREKPAGLVMNERLQHCFHYWTSHNTEVLCNISTQCYFLSTGQLRHTSTTSWRVKQNRSEKI